MKRKWTKKEDDILISEYPLKQTANIAKSLNRSFSSTYQRAYILGLKKSDAYLKTFESGRMVKGALRGVEYRFKKGNEPFNKGLSLSEYLSEDTIKKIKKTQFSCGDMPKNYKPVGSERISKDGYIEIKIADPRTWELKHRHVWRSAGNEIPKGFIIVMKDGDKTNTDISNLELISRIEGMKRNSYHNNYPKEIALAIQAMGAINRQINKKHGKHNTLKEQSI
jgi:hypothetical protein